MNSFQIELKNIQHIDSLNYTIDLSTPKLHCLVGKNGVGKTTLIKAIQNFKQTDTLDKLSRLNIIKEDSEITYTIDGNRYQFFPQMIDDKYILDTNDAINQEYQKNIDTELPMPNDKRFGLYKKLSDEKDNERGHIAYEIQAKFASNSYDDKPQELIDILNRVYDDKNFDTLKQITYKREKYYLIPRDEETYIREDDFSSGEFMIIQIYKLIKNSYKLIVIDELDISLDSRAQVNLLGALQTLAVQNEVNIVFTTHSLAIMKKINNPKELNENLYYMDNNGGIVTIDKRSYNFIKAELFQFTSYAKILLVEDKMLEEYVNYVLRNEPIYQNYKILYIGGADQVIDLMRRNTTSNFFSDAQVKSLLDGDKTSQYSQEPQVLFLPFESIEKELYRLYENNHLDDTVTDKDSLEQKLAQPKPNDNPLGLKAKAKIVIDTISFNDLQCIEFVHSIPENQTKTENTKSQITEFLNQ